MKADTPMLQDLTQSTTAVPHSTSRSAPGPAIKPLPPAAPDMPPEPDLDECSLDNLAALADVAYRAGDRASAEHLVRKLYAQYDQQHDRKAAPVASAAMMRHATCRDD